MYSEESLPPRINCPAFTAEELGFRYRLNMGAVSKFCATMLKKGLYAPMEEMPGKARPYNRRWSSSVELCA